MQDKYINSVMIKLIDHQGYRLVRGEDGEIPKVTGIRILESAVYGNLYLVQLINGDLLSTEEIQERLAINQNVLKDIDGAKAFHFLAAFVFRGTPDPDKLQAIQSGQFKASDKKHLSCITVDLSGKEVIKHSEAARSTAGLEKVLREVLVSGFENDNEAFDIDELLEKKEKEYTLHFAAKKAWLTISLIAINVAIWAAMMVYANLKGLEYDALLMLFGAKENLSIMSGEYWRFLTPIFLHVGFVHLLINSYSLYYVGTITEKLYGHLKFFVVYFAAGILGNIVSFMFSLHPGAGASGSIFGLLGALLYFGVENPVLFRRYFGYNVIATVAINIAYGFSQAGIDNYAHMGGLLGGFLTSGIVKSKETSSKWLKRPVFILVTLCIFAFSLVYGFSNNQNTLIVKLEELEQLNEKESWVEAEKIGIEILNKNPKDQNTRKRTLWALVVAEASQSKFSKAFEYADQMLALDAARGHYLRGALYIDTGQNSMARKELEEAKRLEPVLTEAVDKLLAYLE